MVAGFSRNTHGPRMKSLAACLGLGMVIGGAGAPWDDVSAHTGTSWSTVLLAAHPDTRAHVQEPAPSPKGGAITVTNCDDAGAGSLRDALGSAFDGAVIDLTSLACSEISLTTGALSTGVANVTINGPGADALAINGGGSAGKNNRIISHAGSGLLSISGVTLMDAKYTSATKPVGGCIVSRGSVYLGHAVVTGCGVASSSTVAARGGGVYALDTLTIVRSTISGNSVFASSADAFGGGTHSSSIVASYSAITDNVVNSVNDYGMGGGVYSMPGNLSIRASTISDNHASQYGGGIIIRANTSSTTSEIVNSTISGNSSGIFVGGIYANTALTISNSTLAFNTALLHGGLYIYGAHELNAKNSIVANNSAYGNPSDITAVNAVITGAGNLVGIGGTQLTLPADTIMTDPMLYPLADNGGPTRTHALMAGSPAIDAGSNAGNVPNDQRGISYPREVGARPDIGAFERQGPLDGDYIHVDGFDR